MPWQVQRMFPDKDKIKNKNKLLYHTKSRIEESKLGSGTEPGMLVSSKKVNLKTTFNL